MVNRGFAHCYRVAQTMIATITTKRHSPQGDRPYPGLTRRADAGSTADFHAAGWAGD
jgi:hypothetical protein